MQKSIEKTWKTAPWTSQRMWTYILMSFMLAFYVCHSYQCTIKGCCFRNQYILDPQKVARLLVTSGSNKAVNNVAESAQVQRPALSIGFTVSQHNMNSKSNITILNCNITSAYFKYLMEHFQTHTAVPKLSEQCKLSPKTSVILVISFLILHLLFNNGIASPHLFQCYGHVRKYWTFKIRTLPVIGW